MSFVVPPDAYARFMGRFSVPLGPAFADFVGVRPGQRVLDVGSGPGALTVELVRRLGEESVSAVDPSPPFVAGLAERLPGVDVRSASAEALPFADACFDATVAQLVVHFMSDPVAGLREMARVTRPDGVVAACVWDHDGGRSPLSLCWDAARELDPATIDEAGLPGARAGHLEELAAAAGLQEVLSADLRVEVTFDDADDWWPPYTFGIGPLGTHVAGLDEARRAALRDHCLALLGPAPFTITAHVWAVRARRRGAASIG
ncbi:SAM-dependent methyltransferase [Nocardioides psychrotolerans]|uniref:Methyltransferase domain-containing protein n=1 Tax=Nocardioides psychrotolerans TaxID=1005945 RepID=A0A1I3JIZ0_9ACTN|nr:methyltransferase domain-containing protein [Nocardioides psychrotolerans]GEP38146.1 SAM-dependent methyltransferase [Nocardioides psychrotolerans]SFI59885.1 Methyltransferase domain-containing protein [Nocardioides psychrotolerans]